MIVKMFLVDEIQSHKHSLLALLYKRREKSADFNLSCVCSVLDICTVSQVNKIIIHTVFLLCTGDVIIETSKSV